MPLLSIFSRLEDPRRGPAKRYGLSEIIAMAICAVLCGADDWVEVADWCEDEEEWLKGFLNLQHGTTSHDTFGDVFRVLDPEVFELCFREWIGGLVGVVKDIIALDGKTVRGSKDGAIPPLHLMSVYATSLGLTLGQEGSAGKGNELKAIRALLEALVEGFEMGDVLGLSKYRARRRSRRITDASKHVESLWCHRLTGYLTRSGRSGRRWAPWA